MLREHSRDSCAMVTIGGRKWRVKQDENCLEDSVSGARMPKESPSARHRTKLALLMPRACRALLGTVLQRFGSVRSRLITIRLNRHVSTRDTRGPKK